MNDLVCHRWQQIDTLFGQALEHPPEQRRSFLLEICGTDTDLKAHVEKLLQLHDEAGQILGESADAFAAPLIPGLLDETGASIEYDKKPGSTIGLY